MSRDEDRNSGSRTIVTIFSIIGGVILVSLLVCGGLGYVAMQKIGPVMEKGMKMVEDLQRGTEASQAFVEDLRGGRIDAAYKSTSERYQQEVTREAFDALVKKYPTIQTAGPANPVPGPMTQPKAGQQQLDFSRQEYRYQIGGTTGKSLALDVAVVRQPEGFRIDRLAIAESDTATTTPSTPAPVPAPKIDNAKP